MVLTMAPFLRILTISFIFLLQVTLVLGKGKRDEETDVCGLWLGPSPIKAHEEHGFGLGMFTGKTIAKGDTMPAELLVPIYDWDYDDHPPLREYVWEALEGSLSDMVLESLESMLMFVPGLASIAPCTSVNFNLKLDHTVSYNDRGVNRYDPTTPTAGAFSYRSIAMFTAVRDILPGEELVVECEEDDFDPDLIPRKPFRDETSFCLDNTLEEQLSPIHGKGLFSKRNIVDIDTILLSTPMTPIHRDELKMENKRTQLLLNYCYGHPDSVLLWLPYGPLINSLNHSPSRRPNARVQWRSLGNAEIDDDDDDAHSAGSSQIIQDDDNYADATDHDDIYDEMLSQRKQFHHPELLETLPEEVAKLHGKGLVMDLVSTRAIAAGEEVVIDYGDFWVTAWESHQAQWSEKKGPGDHNNAHPELKSAHVYNMLTQDFKIHTITEQHHKPYPPNLQTACYFEIEWVGDADFQEDVMAYESWNNQDDHFQCLLPCIIMDRNNGEETDDRMVVDDDNFDDDLYAETLERDDDGVSINTRYTAKLIDSHEENVAVDWNCHLYKDFEYIYTDIPREGIIFVEKPHQSDVWLPDAFRQPIGGNNMFPHIWKKKNMRRRTNQSTVDTSNSDKFKRKNVTSRQTALDAIRNKVTPDL